MVANTTCASWNVLPSTPELPQPDSSGFTEVNGMKLWRALYNIGPETLSRQQGTPVVFLHGGFAISEYWAHQIQYLKERNYPIIAIDTRGHGRSYDDQSIPLTYDLLARDVVGLVEQLGFSRFTIVGWSDGANIGYELAINHTERVEALFAFGGVYTPDNIREDALERPVVQQYQQRSRIEYEKLSPQPLEYDSFEKRMWHMWTTLPGWDETSFAKIPNCLDAVSAPLIWVVAADHEETEHEYVARQLHQWILGSSLLLLPAVSHFALLQDPDTFNVLLERFLAKRAN